jgi:hypothetical protein
MAEDTLQQILNAFETLLDIYPLSGADVEYSVCLYIGAMAKSFLYAIVVEWRFDFSFGRFTRHLCLEQAATKQTNLAFFSNQVHTVCS